MDRAPARIDQVADDLARASRDIGSPREQLCPCRPIHRSLFVTDVHQFIGVTIKHLLERLERNHRLGQHKRAGCNNFRRPDSINARTAASSSLRFRSAPAAVCSACEPTTCVSSSRWLSDGSSPRRVRDPIDSTSLPFAAPFGAARAFCGHRYPTVYSSHASSAPYFTVVVISADRPLFDTKRRELCSVLPPRVAVCPI
jgi:hypothetical protein